MADEIKRNEKGQFVKGQVVPAPRRGRPSRADSMPVLIAIAEEAYTPEQLRDMLRETYDMAVEKEDWKGMFQVIQFVLNYAVGKPVQRTLTANVNPDFIKELFQGGKGGDVEDSDDDDVVDVEPDEL